jgi:hypothetical protein
MTRSRLLGTLSSPRWLSTVVIAAIWAIGLAVVFGPTMFHGPLVIGFLGAIFAGGLLLIVVPRRTQALRLQEAVEHRSARPPTGHRADFLRRMGWWKLTWTFETPISMPDSQKFTSDLMVYIKEVRQWPFGDPSTALHISVEGFSTSPGWWWNMPYKVTVTGWCKQSGSGTTCWLEIALAYDPPFEVLFLVVSIVIAIGWLAAIVESAGPVTWLPFLPIAFVPLVIVMGAGVLGRKWVRLRANGLVDQLVTGLQARIADLRMGW